MTRSWRNLGLGLWLALAACASSQPSVLLDEGPGEPIGEQAPVVPTRFVIVDPTTRLYMRADEGAAFLQLRSVEELEADVAQRQATQAERKNLTERDEKAWREREQKRFDRDLKRARTAKQRSAAREARQSRLQSRRDHNATRILQSARADARRYLWEQPSKRAFVFVLVEQQGQWARVETISPDDRGGHCYWAGYGELAAFRMQFFVRSSDLMAVTNERVRVGFDREAGVTLSAGVALRPAAAKGRYQAIVDGFEIEVGLEDRQVARSYQPGDHFEMITTDTVFSDRAQAQGNLRLDRRTALAFNPYYLLYVTETRKVGRTTFATTQTPCAQYVVGVRDDDMTGAPPNSMRFDLRGRDAEAKKPFARAGADLYAPGGELLGQAAIDAHLGVPTENIEGRRCFRKALSEAAQSEASPLDVCVQAEDVVAHELQVF
ncbi:MAG: hypothetical protein H0U74_13280 [Bradymonadaceae bacterium]|nr:hypothetical protein [Lujinxingiaceae bacterium]